MTTPGGSQPGATVGLDSQIELSSLSVYLEQKTILGPLGFAGYWAGWALSKLFVIR